MFCQRLPHQPLPSAKLVVDDDLTDANKDAAVVITVFDF